MKVEVWKHHRDFMGADCIHELETEQLDVNGVCLVLTTKDNKVTHIIKAWDYVEVDRPDKGSSGLGGVRSERDIPL